MSINRLFQTINILLDKKTVTALELAEKFEVSVRTIYRDINTLSGAGVPVYTKQGKGGGIAILNSYILDKSLLSVAEQEHILLALKNTLHMNLNSDSNSASDSSQDELLVKVQNLFQKTGIDWMEVDLSRWGGKIADKEKFTLIKKSILEKYLLSFSYTDSNESTSSRLVKPAKILFKAKSWYLQAFCTDKKAYRTFKVNRMLGIQLEKKHFTEDLNPPEIDFVDFSKSDCFLKLRIHKRMAARVYDEFDEKHVFIEDNGDFILSLNMPEDLWLYGFLLSFGEDLQVLEPQHIKDSLAEKIKKMFMMSGNSE